MIVHFDVCALIITVFLILSMIIRKQLTERTNIILFVLLNLVMLSTLTDLLSAVISQYGEVTHTNYVWMYAVNYVYFFAHSLVIPVYILYVYSSIDVWHIFTSKRILEFLWYLDAALNITIVALNGFAFDIFSITEGNQYQRGSGAIIVYVLAVAMSVWGILLIFKYKKVFHRDKAATLLTVYPLIAIGVFVQFIAPGILIENFAVVIAILFFMMIVKREENQIDPITGAIKYNEGIERVTNSFITHKPAVVVLIKIVNYNNLSLYLGLEKYNNFLFTNTQKFKEIGKSLGANFETFFLENGLFALLIEGKDKKMAIEIAERIRMYLFKEVECDGFSVLPDARICVVKCPDEIKDFSTLFSMGTTFHDTMPNNKDVHLYSDFKDDKNFKIRNEMDDIIARGLANNAYEMYYQPIYSVEEKRFVSAEALIRLNDENYGTLSPGLFIPVAEINGLIHEIGDFVIEDVIKFISEHDLRKLKLKHIQLNLSASQCIEVDLVEKIINLLDKYQVSPECLGLELTEAAADINPQIVDQNIQALHEHGLRIALDDYGTGYSNIKRVTALPIDQVKLDKSFVEMIDDPRMWIVIQDTINMLKEMGKEILVEGVENESEAIRFTELDTDLFLGCELIQGFYFCKPLKAEEFVAFIRRHL